MLELALAAVLAAAVTVAEGGLVFQPALSPDGSQVAYAADEDGQVSLYVVPSSGGGAPTKIASIGRGADAQRLIAHALLHRPWSADGARLLFLAPDETGRFERLFVVEVRGGQPVPAGPREGLIESAAWLDSSTLVFTYRDSREADKQKIYAYSAIAADAPRELMEYREATIAVDLAPSPDARWLATLNLTGPRDARKREIRVLDLKSFRETVIEYTGHANFLAWTPDSTRLSYIDTLTHEVPLWVAGDATPSPALVRGIYAFVIHEGYLLGLDAEGVLAAYGLEAGVKRNVLAAGYVPISSAGAKLALVRCGQAGAAIVVADASRAAIEAGDIGLPKPSGTAAPPPSGQPEGPKAPAPPPPPRRPENGAVSPFPAGTVPPAPPG